MDINAFNAMKTYGAAQKTLSAGVDAAKAGKAAGAPASAAGGDDAGFQPLNAVKTVADTVAKSETAAAAFMTGEADPHSVVEAMAAAEMAVETAVTLRNRVVEAYQELLRMPI